jgi:hypothetical protein
MVLHREEAVTEKYNFFTVNVEGVVEVTGKLPHPYTGVGTATEAHLTTQTDSNTQNRTTETTEDMHTYTYIFHNIIEFMSSYTLILNLVLHYYYKIGR